MGLPKPTLAFASLALLVSIGPAQTPPGSVRPLAPRAASPSSVVAETIQYHPHLDPESYFGQAAYAALEEAVFGVQTNQTIWNLDLDSPVVQGNFAIGSSRLGLPFSVVFSSLVVGNTDNPAVTRVGCWSGVVSGAAGHFHCYGLYLENGESASLVPLYARRDRVAAMNIQAAILEASGGGFVPRQFMCALDDVAAFQSGQNRINASACADAHFNQYMGIMLTCGTIGVASCWRSFGVGCLGGAVCVATLTIKDYFRQQTFASEWERALGCRCFESQWRGQHPGQPLPNPTCGNFACPNTPDVTIPKLN
ncbi:MAG: hypothetical protein ACK4WH_14225 [Phycisphaerales bacterium]